MPSLHGIGMRGPRFCSERREPKFLQLACAKVSMRSRCGKTRCAMQRVVPDALNNVTPILPRIAQNTRTYEKES